MTERPREESGAVAAAPGDAASGGAAPGEATAGGAESSASASPLNQAAASESDLEGWSRRRVVFLAVSGTAVVGLLVWASEVLLPFMVALLVAYVLTPLVALCERLRVPRWLAILLVYATTFAVGYRMVAAVAPRLYADGAELGREVPQMARRLTTEWAAWAEQQAQAHFGIPASKPGAAQGAREPVLRVTATPDGSFEVNLVAGVEIVQESSKRWRVRPSESAAPSLDIRRLVGESLQDLMGYLRRNALELVVVGQVIVRALTRGIFLTFMTLMVAGYLMLTRESIVAFFRSLAPPRARPSFDRLIRRVDRGFAGVVRGQLLIMLVNGLLSALGFWLFDLKHWPLLALVAGLMSIIPIFGSILSSVPSVLVGLTQSFWTALWVLAWIIGIHQVEANLLNPKIIGVAAKLHPVLVVFALVVGEHSFGLWGALLAVPTLSLAQSCFNHFRFEALADAPSDGLALDAADPESG